MSDGRNDRYKWGPTILEAERARGDVLAAAVRAVKDHMDRPSNPNGGISDAMVQHTLETNLWAALDAYEAGP